MKVDSLSKEKSKADHEIEKLNTLMNKAWLLNSNTNRQIEKRNQVVVERHLNL